MFINLLIPALCKSFTYFFISLRLGPYRFQSEGRKRRHNLALVFMLALVLAFIVCPSVTRRYCVLCRNGKQRHVIIIIIIIRFVKRQNVKRLPWR